MTTLINLVPYVPAQSSGTPARTQSANVSGPAARDAAKLGKAAGEFEAMLLNSLWQSMKGTFSSEEDEGEGDPILKSFDDWGTQALSQAANSVGALGVKPLLLQHLTPLLGAAEPARE
jgi:Rod binding domain-containing protein